MEDTERKKRKQQVYLVSSSREKGCGILNGALFASKHRDNQIHPYRNREGYAWQGSKEEQGRSDVRQSPIKNEIGDIWRQTIETTPKDSLYRSCSKGGRSLAKIRCRIADGWRFRCQGCCGIGHLVGLWPTGLVQEYTTAKESRRPIRLAFEFLLRYCWSNNKRGKRRHIDLAVVDSGKSSFSRFSSDLPLRCQDRWFPLAIARPRIGISCKRD